MSFTAVPPRGVHSANSPHALYSPRAFDERTLAAYASVSMSATQFAALAAVAALTNAPVASASGVERNNSATRFVSQRPLCASCDFSGEFPKYVIICIQTYSRPIAVQL